MPKLQIKPGPYARLQKLAAGNGSHANIGIVIGDTSVEAATLYLDHMKKTDPKLWKTWGSKWKPEEDEDLVDPTADDDDEPVGEATAGLDELFKHQDDEPEPASVVTPPASSKAALGIKSPAALTKEISLLAPGEHIVDGVAYPPIFKFRDKDGITVELEVMSKNPQWGFMLRYPVVADKRTILLSGGELEVDLLALRRNPDGMTEFMGRKYSNSKLITALELQEND